MKPQSALLTGLLLVSPLVAFVASSDDDPTNRKLFDLNEMLGGLSGPDWAVSARASNKTSKADWINVLFKKKPYSQYWSAEKKWEDIFTRFMAVSESASSSLLKGIVKNIETYADIAVSNKCTDDIRWIQEYQKKANNLRWAIHMADSSGHTESGMLAGNLAHLGHVVQCVNVRAPRVPNNDTFGERYFEEQTRRYGERFRGKYCLASIRAVMPERPRLVSRFSQIIDVNKLSNISFAGESAESLKQRLKQLTVPTWAISSIDRQHNRLDQLPFESELFQFLISQRNFMYTLPRMLGTCFPSSCTRDDVRQILQKVFEEQHQVVDLEFECETEPVSSWSWFNTPRLVVHVLVALVFALSFGASVARYIMVDKLALKKRLPKTSPLRNFIGVLDLMSMDKCAGILLIKMKPASTEVDESRLENRRSTSIDALRGFLILCLVYSQLIYLGCLPLPFMWAKWGDAMFPFFRALQTQLFLNVSLWSEAFYMISAYLIGAKLLEDHRPSLLAQKRTHREPNFAFYLLRRYVRLVIPMVAFMMLNYVWPRLSNGWVMQDQAGKLLAPCDAYGWTNMLMFHNHYQMNDTCLWPSHVSASFFQLHLLSYPILLLLLYSLKTRVDSLGVRKLVYIALKYSGLLVLLSLALIGLIYPAYRASQQDLIVPFLIDYIDYDNYQRVIEWTVMPTHNHLTSYMVGLALAYLVVRRRQEQEEALRDSSSNQCLHMDSSMESVVASSTHQLHLRPSFKANLEVNRNTRRSDLGSSYSSKHSNDGQQEARGCHDFASAVSSLLVTIVMLITLSASWAWTGLGQPMSSNQTFWYMIGTKLLFTSTFAYLFYKHFATRRNSASPWMITRFLVPIGRMSLTAFYVSWLVVWFDLLASLYQWFPSHYFIIEKYNEIIFMTLVIAMFVYGAFEGIVKIHDYTRSPSTTTRDSSNAEPKGFAGYFTPVQQNDDTREEPEQMRAANNEQEKTALDNQKSVISIQLNPAHKPIGTSNKLSTIATLNKADTTDHSNAIANQPPVDQRKTGGGGGKLLSIADQYKLNTELRANYSFASIGLYETAGATEDLMLARNGTQLSSSAASPATQKR